MAEGRILLGILTLGLSALLLPKKPEREVTTQPTDLPVRPRRRNFGRVRVKGEKVFEKRSILTGDGILYMAFALNSGEIDAIEEHWIQDQITRIDPSSLGGSGGSDPGAYVIGNVIYPGIWYDNGRVTISEHLGLPTQTADALIQSGFPGTWTAQHRLDGVAYVALRLLGVPLQDFNIVYKFGIPSYAATIRAAKYWDPRVSSQDPDDPTTWAWTDNAALIIMGYLWDPDGMRLPRAMIETAIPEWITVANYCDDLMPLLSGLTEPRYRLCGGYDFDEEPKSVLSRMLACIDGRVRLNEHGSIVLDVGQFDCPTSCETFATADILGVESFRRGASKGDLRNEIRAKYLSPGHNYQEQEADPLRNDTSVLIDGLQSATLDLTYCPSHRQARVMMKVASYRMNPEWQGTIITNAKGLRLLGKRYARFQIATLGIDEVFFIQRSDIDLRGGRCTFQVISFPPEAYCWEPCEEGVSPEHERPGDHGICVPVGACEVTIRAVGGGGGGGEGNGGGGGGFAEKTIAIDPADWGAVILFTNGAAGIGHVDDSFNLATDGGDSTVTGTLVAGSIAMTAIGGTRGSIGGAGGGATGGDTNISGTTSSGGDGGLSGDGANENESPGGGGHEQVDGGIGLVTFEWKFDCPASEGASSGGSEGMSSGGSSGGDDEEDEEVLITEVVTSGSQTDVTFSSIPATYRDLEIRVRGRGTKSASEAGIRVQFNGDTGNNYTFERGYFVGGGTFAADASGVDYIWAGSLPGATATANRSGGFDLRITDYRGTTFHKSTHTVGGARSSGPFSTCNQGEWHSTSAINAVKVFPETDAFVDGTVVSLYGRM